MEPSEYVARTCCDAGPTLRKSGRTGWSGPKGAAKAEPSPHLAWRRPGPDGRTGGQHRTAGAARRTFFNAATKTHINNTPAYYYNYAFATVFKFQLHDYIARKILHQPPQSCNYADNKEVGTWLNNILKKGGTEDWRKVLKEATGEDISTRAMTEYFKPLMTLLEEQNKGRQIGWEY